MSEKTLNDWQAAATALKIDGQAFINGRRCSSSSGETRPTLNPAIGEALTNVAYCDRHFPCHIRKRCMVTNGADRSQDDTSALGRTHRKA